MSYIIEFKTVALVGFEVLTSTIQERILRKISWLSDNFDHLTPQTLSADLSGLFKLRIGDYRVIYSFEIETQLITIHKVGHRRDLYS